MLDEKLRKRLSQPFGPVLQFSEVAAKISKKRPKTLVAVGDNIVVNLLNANLIPDVAVVDFSCQRKPVPNEWRMALEKALQSNHYVLVPNPAGSVHPKMEKELQKLLVSAKGWMVVEGEDDLCSLVVMANALPKTLLLYGQPNLGVVWVEVEPKVQKLAQNLLERVKKS